MEDKEKRTVAARDMAEEVKKLVVNMDEDKQERAIGVLIGLSINKELLDKLSKSSA